MTPHHPKRRLHVTVAAVIENEGRFLMVEELRDGRTVINQPAGHLEAGESFINAVIRETLEETAWRFQPQAQIGVYRWVHPSGETFLRHCFTGIASEHLPERELDADILRALWLSQDELVQRQASLRSPLVLQCIEDYLAGKRYPLETYIDLI